MPVTVDIQQILDDLANSDPLAIDLAKRTRDLALKLGLPAVFADQLSRRVGVSVGLILAAVGLVISIALAIADPILRIFLRVLTKARTDTVPEQIDISAAVLSEFLAAEISPEQLKTGKTGDQTIDAARVIGRALHARLTKEFVPQGTVTPESGEAAAQTFTGYAINFAVQNTMIGTLADALSFHLLEDFRDLGVEVARNIGLGRLVRLALTPLVRNAIQEPYDQALRKRYRPDLLSEAHAVAAFQGGFIDPVELHEILARKGYSDKYISIVTDQHATKLTDTELSVLLRHGRTSKEYAFAEMARAGIDPQHASYKLGVNDLQRTDSLVTTYKSLITKQRIEGLIGEDTYNKLLDRLPITEEEKQLERNFVGTSLEVPRAFLTWSEVEKAFELGAVDLTYVDTWLAREGFSDEDTLVKELLLLVRLDKTITKEQAAEKRRAAKRR